MKRTARINGDDRVGHRYGSFFVTRGAAGWDVYDLSTGHQVGWYGIAAFADARDKAKRLQAEQDQART